MSSRKLFQSCTASTFGCVAIASASMLMLTACEDGSAEEAGEQIDDAADEVADGVEDAADEVGDTIDDATDDDGED